MATTLGYPVNTRRLVDVSLSNTVTMPNLNNTVNTAWLNLVQSGNNNGINFTGYNIANNPTGYFAGPAGQIQPAGPYVITEKVLLNVQVTSSSQAGNGTTGATTSQNIYLQMAPALSNGAVDTGNVVNVPLRSAFISSNIPYLQQTANANSYTQALNIIDQLPPFILQYVRCQIVAGANASNNATDSTLTIQLYF